MFVQPIGNMNKSKFGVNLSAEDFKCKTKNVKDKENKLDKKAK